jgi:hypothetical protein
MKRRAQARESSRQVVLEKFVEKELGSCASLANLREA